MSALKRKRERGEDDNDDDDTEGRKPNRAEEKIGEVARRICILIRNLAESFLRSPSFPILFYTAPPRASQSSKDRRRLFVLLLPSSVAGSRFLVLFLPHYAGLAYPGRRWTQPPRRKVVSPWKMSIKTTRRDGGKRTRGVGNKRES